MPNPVAFLVQCRLYPLRQERIYVYYVERGGKQFPLPPNICDNGCGEAACQECVAAVLSAALHASPPSRK